MFYSDLTYTSSRKLKRWTHQKRFYDALDFLNLNSNDILLDYGCGDGFLLELALSKLPPRQLYGFEPAEALYQQAQNKLAEKGVSVHQTVENLPKNHFTKITCFETCEHLNTPELQVLLRNIHQLLHKDGQAIISVPIEIGPPALAKNIFRFIEYGSYDNLSAKNFIKSIFGLPVKRNTNQLLEGLPFIYSHVGFDYREFAQELAKHFHIEKVHKSPFKPLPAVLNNTVYYVCTKRT